jgi:carboxymethylenebutenolidase
MPTTTLEISTAHGPFKTQIFTPDGAGPWPVVLVFIDAFGVRPSMAELSARIAKGGYLVALPDLFYRVGSPYDVLAPGLPHEPKSFDTVWGDSERRNVFMSKYLGPAMAYDHLRDTVGPLLDTLAKRPDVRGGGVGTTGYCMGGNISLRVATLFGDRIAAAASFHGGNLVTPAPDSLHTRVDRIKARVYIAGAIEDGSFTDEAKATLTHALEAAHVKHTVETYPARHGFAVSDNPAFDASAAERHYAALTAVLGGTFGS